MIHVTGDRELDRRLQHLAGKELRKGLRVSTRAAAKLVLADAKRLAPHEEGTLEASLAVRTKQKGRRNRRDEVGHAVVTREGMFRGETFYGGFLEFGTAPRQTRGGAERGRVDGSRWAFLRPALYGQRPAIIRAFQANMRRWINQQAGRGLSGGAG